jgi:tyrosyl-tRNA synthetase
VEQIAQMKADAASGKAHPMALKKELARSIVADFHSAEAAAKAAEDWAKQFQKDQVPEEEENSSKPKREQKIDRGGRRDFGCSGSGSQSFQQDDGHDGEVEKVAESQGAAVDSANQYVLGHPIQDRKAQIQSSRNLQDQNGMKIPAASQVRVDLLREERGADAQSRHEQRAQTHQ